MIAVAVIALLMFFSLLSLYWQARRDIDALRLRMSGVEAQQLAVVRAQIFGAHYAATSQIPTAPATEYVPREVNS